MATDASFLNLRWNTFDVTVSVKYNYCMIRFLERENRNNNYIISIAWCQEWKYQFQISGCIQMLWLDTATNVFSPNGNCKSDMARQAGIIRKAEVIPILNKSETCSS